MDHQDPAKLLDEHVARLGEHFDSVQIFCTWHDGSKESTHFAERGSGNFYARLGQVGEWLEIQRQYQRNHAIRRDRSDDE